jgi:hypothetical protein
MIEPFKRVNGKIVPVATEGSEWFFTKPSNAQREYEGILMALTPGRRGYEGWQYYVPMHLDILDDGTVVTDNTDYGWHPVYPRVSLPEQLMRSIKGEWNRIDSPFEYVDQFEEAELLFSEDYPIGEYWLLPEEKYLIPVNCAEQISNINELAIHKIQDVEKVFVALQRAMRPLRNNVYGVIFNRNGTRARIRPSDFDWEEYE